MSIPVVNPHIIAGSPRSSGDIQTGEIPWTRGGGRVVSVSGTFSGNPDGSVGLASGIAGRLANVVLHNTPGNPWSQSGIVVQFYDAALPVSGAPLQASGHKLLAVLNGPVGHSGQLSQTGKFEIDMPFQSGLFARAASGAPGFTVSITPEVVPNKPFGG